MSIEDMDPFATGSRTAPTASLSNKGDKVGGVIVDAKVVQDREYDASNPGRGPRLYWDENGKKTTTTPTDRPVTYSMYIVQAFEPTPEDDGRRAIRANNPRKKKAIEAAKSAANVQRMGLGGYLSMENTGKEKGKGPQPANTFASVYFTPAQVDAGEAPTTAVMPVPKDDDPFA